ncbi:MAG: pantoate--beta-alanine ligase [Candidatus Hydrogenedentota bacterium]
MIIIDNAKDMRAWSLAQRKRDRTIGCVPTMGALHEGHVSLIDASMEHCDTTALTIFVNPAQFAPHEDFDQYPRTFESDCAIALEKKVDVVYAPKASGMYPENYATYIEVERLQEGLCGGTRPHFFRGVATVVAKLFNAVTPDKAFFGMKDGQQITIIKRMVRDLDFGVEIVGLPTIREEDGLAMSSRNQYLSSEDRKRALSISRALFNAHDAMAQGETDAAHILQQVRDELDSIEVDYISLVDGSELTVVDRIDGPIMLAVAATVGTTRLIDNIRFEPSTITHTVPSAAEAKV